MRMVYFLCIICLILRCGCDPVKEPDGIVLLYGSQIGPSYKINHNTMVEPVDEIKPMDSTDDALRSSSSSNTSDAYKQNTTHGYSLYNLRDFGKKRNNSVAGFLEHWVEKEVERITTENKLSTEKEKGDATLKFDKLKGDINYDFDTVDYENESKINKLEVNGVIGESSNEYEYKPDKFNVEDKIDNDKSEEFSVENDSKFDKPLVEDNIDNDRSESSVENNTEFDKLRVEDNIENDRSEESSVENESELDKIKVEDNIDEEKSDESTNGDELKTGKLEAEDKINDDRSVESSNEGDFSSGKSEVEDNSDNDGIEESSYENEFKVGKLQDEDNIDSNLSEEFSNEDESDDKIDYDTLDEFSDKEKYKNSRTSVYMNVPSVVATSEDNNVIERKTSLINTFGQKSEMNYEDHSLDDESKNGYNDDMTSAIDYDKNNDNFEKNNYHDASISHEKVKNFSILRNKDKKKIKLKIAGFVIVHNSNNKTKSNEIYADDADKHKENVNNNYTNIKEENNGIDDGGKHEENVNNDKKSKNKNYTNGDGFILDGDTKNVDINDMDYVINSIEDEAATNKDDEKAGDGQSKLERLLLRKEIPTKESNTENGIQNEGLSRNGLTYMDSTNMDSKYEKQMNESSSVKQTNLNLSRRRRQIEEPTPVPEDTLTLRRKPDKKRPSKKVCRVPKHLSHSHLECTAYPQKVICNQTCVFGYTTNKGVKRVQKCNLNKGRWSPSRAFSDCKPFVDCTVRIGAGGKKKCYENYMKRGPKCEISCKAYRNKKATKPKNYNCDIKGHWSPKLPHCAKAGTRQRLVKRPKKIPPSWKKVNKKSADNSVSFENEDSAEYSNEGSKENSARRSSHENSVENLKMDSPGDSFDHSESEAQRDSIEDLKLYSQGDSAEDLKLDSQGDSTEDSRGRCNCKKMKCYNID